VVVDAVPDLELGTDRESEAIIVLVSRG